jgi:hypothetical protein
VRQGFCCGSCWAAIPPPARSPLASTGRGCSGWRTGQLQKRFGALPQSFLDALEAATQADLDAWCDRILDATTLDEVIRS